MCDVKSRKGQRLSLEGKTIPIKTGHKPLQLNLKADRHGIHTRCFCSSVRTSLRTLAHGMSSGHQMGLQLSLPQPGFPRPVEYFSISGMKARSCAWNKPHKRVESFLGAHFSGSFEAHNTELLHLTSMLLEPSTGRGLNA